jgi:hypothetical protein
MTNHLSYTTISLQQLISKLVTFYTPVAHKQKCYFINSAAFNLYIKSNAELLGTLLGSLFYIVARCSRDSAILITAACYHDRAAISIQCSCKADKYHILHSFKHLELLSKELNGFLEINNYVSQQTTITFNLSNNLAAALPDVNRSKDFLSARI